MKRDQRVSWIITWNTRMFAKYGKPNGNNDWIRKLAYHMGEEGADVPSLKAIEVAKEWECGKKKPKAENT